MITKRSEAEKEFIKDIGKRIKDVRTTKRLTQAELADALGYQYKENKGSAIYQIEAGVVKTMDIVLLLRICSALDVNFKDLVPRLSIPGDG